MSKIITKYRKEEYIMKKEETNEMTVAAGTNMDMTVGAESFEIASINQIWFAPMSFAEMYLCLKMNKISHKGYDKATAGFIPVVSYDFPEELATGFIPDDSWRIVVRLTSTPVRFPEKSKGGDYSAPEYAPFLRAVPYMSHFSEDISIENWIAIEHREDGKWIPQNILPLCYKATLDTHANRIDVLKKAKHEILVAKEAEISKLMRENSSLAARYNFERAQIIQARDLTQSQNLNLMKVVERFSGDTLLLENMALTENLEMKQLELDIAIEEKWDFERQRNDLKRKNDYLEGFLRQHGIYNHNMPPTQPAALAA
jgi:hypothetical protein